MTQRNAFIFLRLPSSEEEHRKMKNKLMPLLRRRVKHNMRNLQARQQNAFIFSYVSSHFSVSPFTSYVLDIKEVLSKVKDERET